MSAGHGPDLGHGYVKYVIIDSQGKELPPLVFPAQIARAERGVVGALGQIRAVAVGDTDYWTGDEARYSAAPLTLLGQQRLSDPVFIPALLSGALARLGNLNGAAGGVCVTGLPATWARDEKR